MIEEEVGTANELFKRTFHGEIGGLSVPGGFYRGPGLERKVLGIMREEQVCLG